MTGNAAASEGDLQLCSTADLIWRSEDWSREAYESLLIRRIIRLAPPSISMNALSSGGREAVNDGLAGVEGPGDGTIFFSSSSPFPDFIQAMTDAMTTIPIIENTAPSGAVNRGFLGAQAPLPASSRKRAGRGACAPRARAAPEGASERSFALEAVITTSISHTEPSEIVSPLLIGADPTTGR